MVDEVRDIRQRGWSWFDNAVIDHFGPMIGAYAVAVYMALVRHSDSETQTCYPSYDVLAKELKISRNTVKRAITTLSGCGLIRKKLRTSKSGDPDSNLYTLINTWGGAYRDLPQDNLNIDVTNDLEGVGPIGTEVGPIGTGVGPIGTEGVGPIGATNNTQHINKKKPSISSEGSDDDTPTATDTPVLKIQDLIQGWNEICAGQGLLPKKLRPSDSLRRQIKLRLQEQPDHEFWQVVFNNCCISPFLRGENDRNWCVDLDWLVKNDKNAIRVYEGGFSGLEKRRRNQ